LYIYVSRLLAPIWNKKLLYELNTQLDNSALNEQLTAPTVFASFSQINLDFYIERLVNLRQFIDINYKYIQQLQMNQQKQQFLHEILNEVLSNFVQIIRPQGQRLTQYTSLSLNTATLLGISGSSGGAMNDKLPFELEKQSIYCLKRYIDYLIEIFELWKILDEHKYHFISAKLDKQLQDDLLNMNIQNFLFADYHLYEQLITALIHRYIDDNVSSI
jgi:hypothetical protein